MAWSELQAARGMAALADAGCELVEQPVATAGALARLVRRFPVALMADESLHGPRSAFDLAKVARQSVVSGKGGSERVDHGGGRIVKQQHQPTSSNKTLQGSTVQHHTDP